MKITKIVTPSPEQWDIMIKAIYNEYADDCEPDSYITHIENPETMNVAPFQFFLGDTDLSVMRVLYNAGKRGFMSNLPIHISLTASDLFWLAHDLTPSKYGDTVIKLDYYRAACFVKKAITPEDRELAAALLRDVPYLADIMGL